MLGIWLLADRDGLSDHPGRYFWLFLALLMLHHFEELAFPGGVQCWLNETVFESPDPTRPFTDRRAFVNDVVFGWGAFALAAVVGTRLTWFAFIPMFVLAFDAWFHISYTVASGRYSPGTVTALVLIAPITFYAVTTFLERDLVSYGALTTAAVLALLADAGFFIALRWARGRTPPARPAR